MALSGGIFALPSSVPKAVEPLQYTAPLWLSTMVTSVLPLRLLKHAGHVAPWTFAS